MYFFYRLFSFICSALVVSFFYFQFKDPFDYPYIVLIGVVIVPVAAILMARKRITYYDLLEKMLPLFVLLGVLVFAMLLAEKDLVRWMIIIVGGGSTFISLELLYYLIFMPSRYPVHGLAKMNIVYVPFIVWYFVSTSVGLMTFLHSSAWIHVVVMFLLGILIFRTTGHPEATKEQNRRWMFIGGLVGLHLGLLNVMLPISMLVQGAFSMLILGMILRMRRYLYHPIPSKYQAWAEGVVAIIMIVIVMSTTRWL
ncbi:hypothetical protein KKG46_02200 [Patescibacteria group bacterium]|nr:hypothetical protein [Patescibacteria group bacterium]